MAPVTTVDPVAVLGDLERQLDDPIFTHIIRTPAGDPRSAGAIVLEARVMGTPVTALCGHTWVPSRDPERHPVCERCVAIFKAHANN